MVFSYGSLWDTLTLENLFSLVESVHASARLKNVSVLNSESQGAPRSGGGERVIQPLVDDMHANAW